MTMPIWEEICKTPNDITERLKIPGGWLVCRRSGNHLPHSLVGWSVRDPDYRWNIIREGDPSSLMNRS